jgi:hypothetical protein
MQTAPNNPAFLTPDPSSLIPGSYFISSPVPVVHCALFTVHFSLFTFHFSLFTYVPNHSARNSPLFGAHPRESDRVDRFFSRVCAPLRLF